MTTQQYSKQVGVTPGSGITDINGQIGPSINIAIDDIGTDVNITPGVPNPNDITINVPIASSTQTGKLTNTDWQTFNNKVDGPVSSVDGEIALYNGVTGKVIKRATGSGVVTATNGVYGTVAPGTTGNVLTSNGTSWVSQAPSTGDPELFALRLTSGSRTTDTISYNSGQDTVSAGIGLYDGNGYLLRVGNATQTISFGALGIGTYGQTMINGGYVYVMDGNDGSNVFRADVTTDISNIANWSAVTVSHVWTHANQLLLGVNAGKVYVLDYGVGGSIVERFDFVGATWTYEASQFTCLNPLSAPITGANPRGIVNSQGFTIQRTATDIWMLQYNFAGSVLKNFGSTTLITADTVLFGLPNTQYSGHVEGGYGSVTKLYL